VTVIIFSTIFILNVIIWRIYQSQILNRLTILCIWTALTMWYFLPAAIAGIYQERTPFSIFYLYQDNVSRETWFQDFTILFVLESLSVLCVLILILSSSRARQYAWKQKTTNLQYDINCISGKTKTLILVVGAVMLLYKIANFGSNSDYLSNNSADGYGNADALSQLIDFVKPISYSMVILIAIYEQKKISFVRMAFAQVIVESTLSTMSGARIYMLTPFIIFAFRLLSLHTLSNKNLSTGVRQKKDKQKEIIRLAMTFFATFLFLIYVFLPIAKSIGDVRAEGEFNLYDVVVGTFVNQKQSSQLGSEASRKMDDIESIFIKLDSFTNGAILNNTSGYGTGGIMPYIGSALVFIPRFIIPEKPIAGTSDGTIYTHPSRIVTRSLGVQSDAMNVPSSPLSITFWHFGYFGFIVFVLFSYAHLKYLDYLINSPSFIYKAIGLSSLNLPGFTGVFSAPDVIVKDCVMIFVIVFTINMHLKITKTVV
jgi:hypothetical protein